MRSHGSTQIKKRRGFGRTFFNLSYLSNSISKSYTQHTQKIYYINPYICVVQNLIPTLADCLCEDQGP